MNRSLIFSLLLITNITTYAMLTPTQENLSNASLEEFFTNISQLTPKNNVESEKDLLSDIIKYSRFTQKQGPNHDLNFTQARIFKITQSHHQSKRNSHSKL